MLSAVRQFSTHSTLTQVQEQVVAGLAQGQTISAAASAAGIHRGTIHNWLNSEPAFASALTRARQEYSSSLREELVEMGKSAVAALRQLLDDPATPPATRVKIALAILARAEAIPVSAGSAAQEHTMHSSDSPGSTPRNAPCPCGSGEKYKRCCGRFAPPVLGFVSPPRAGA